MSGHMLSIATCVHHSRWSTSGPHPVKQNPSNLIPSHIPKRFICHATVAAKLYTSKKGKIVKDYLEQEGLKACAATTKGVDDAGAESAEVVGAGHEGGTVPNERFHLNIVVKDGHDKIMQTDNPATKEKTKRWHAYIGKNKGDLYAIADAWKKSHK